MKSSPYSKMLDNITSVVIPVYEEYYEIKNGAKPKKNLWIESQTKDFKEIIMGSYLKRMEDELKIIVPVEGMGKGKYKFSM